jgi:hypothetical protein
MATPDIKTFLVDGGMPGCGRSLAVRTLADLYIRGYQDKKLSHGRVPKARVYVWDACNDPTIETGYQMWHARGDATVHTGKLDSEQGAQAYGTIANLVLEAAQDGPVRFIIDLPAVQDSELLEKRLMNGMLHDLNAIPIWILTRQAMSLGLLADRVDVMPEIYRNRGVVIRNSKFSHWNDYVEWRNSGLRRALVEHGRWLDLYMLFCNQHAQAAMDRDIPNMPFNIANEKALADGAWMGLLRIAIQLFAGSECDEWNVIETL